MNITKLNSPTILIIGIILLTIGFYHLLTFPNILNSLYMILLVILCNGIGGGLVGVAIAKSLRGE